SMAKGSRRTTPCWPAAAAVVSEPIVAAMYTPSTQLRASVTSGTVSERRSPENEGIDGDARRIVPFGVNDRILVGGDGKARVGMCRLAPASGRPVAALPVEAVRRLGAHALPPHIAVISERDIGEDD